MLLKDILVAMVIIMWLIQICIFGEILQYQTLRTYEYPMCGWWGATYIC